MTLRGTVRDVADRRVIALSEILGIQLPYAIGIIECLRHLCYHVKQGGIGKYSNEHLAMCIFYTDNADQLIEALVASGCARLDPVHRVKMVIYRWDGGNKKKRWERMKAAGGEISQKVRAFVYARDGFRCLYCETSDDLSIDHIFPVCLGGTNALTNLQTLCRPCNSRKKDRVDG